MVQSWNSRCWQELVTCLVIGEAIALCGTCTPAQSQIIPDNTLGAESSVVTPNASTNGIPSEQIDGGAVRGANLFHSFREFNIGEGRAAYFSNPTGIENIVSRVTGGNLSSILGTLGVLGGNANLFLINPNGIIFGANARLEIGGSFVASTASSLKLSNGNEFSATAPQTVPLLTVSVPIGLQFGDNPGGIVVQGNGEGIRSFNDPIMDNSVGLYVQPNQTLALVGGDVALLGGTLKTAGGRIELGSVAPLSLVHLSPSVKGWSLGYEGVQIFGDIQLSGRATADASGIGGGDIQVQGRQVTLRDGSQIEASTIGSQPGGTLSVTASELVELIGQANPQTRSSLVSLVYPNATGTGSNVTVKTKRLSVRDRAYVGAGTYFTSQGQGGSLTVTASDFIQLVGSDSSLSTSTLGSGDAGELTISTSSLRVQDGAFVSTNTSNTGKGGNLSVTASDRVELRGTSPNGNNGSALFTQTENAGNAGKLSITTGNLYVQDGAVVSAATRGAGKGGELQVNVSNSISLSGVAPSGRSSGLFTSTSGEGDAGNINVDTNALRVANGAVISARTRSLGNAGNITVNANILEAVDGGQVLTATRSSGNAGTINLSVADSINLSGSDPTFTQRLAKLGSSVNNEGAASGIFANTAPNSTGQGGNLAVVTGNLNVRDGAGISVSSQGLKDAGNLELTARFIGLGNSGELTAETNSGQGGNIQLQADNLLLHPSSKISTTAGLAGAGGDGGNIKIDTGLLIALENSNITANAFTGSGGRIQINTQGIFRFPGSNITASSEFGVDGVTEINTPEIEPSSELATLPAQIVEVSELIAQGCPAMVGSDGSKFVLTGRGGLPPTPSEALNSDNILVDLGLPVSAQTDRAQTAKLSNPTRKETSFQKSTPIRLVEAQGWAIGDNGEVVLTDRPVTATPEIPWLTATNCHTAKTNP